MKDGCLDACEILTLGSDDWVYVIIERKSMDGWNYDLGQTMCVSIDRRSAEKHLEKIRSDRFKEGFYCVVNPRFSAEPPLLAFRDDLWFAYFIHEGLAK